MKGMMVGVEYGRFGFTLSWSSLCVSSTAFYTRKLDEKLIKFESNFSIFLILDNLMKIISKFDPESIIKQDETLNEIFDRKRYLKAVS